MVQALLFCLIVFLSSFIYGQDSIYYNLDIHDKIPRSYNLELQKEDFYTFESKPTLPLHEKIKLLSKVIYFRPKNKIGRKASIYRDRILQTFADSLQREWKLEWEGSSYMSEGIVPLEKDQERLIFKEEVIIRTKNKTQETLPYKILSLGVNMWGDIFITIAFNDKSWIVHIDEVSISNRMASIGVKEKKNKRFLYLQERWVACGALEIFGSRPYSNKNK